MKTILFFFFQFALLAQTFPFPGPNNPSHVSAAFTVTGKICGAVGGSSSTSVTCTWSSPLASGETANCAVYNFTVGGTYSMVDAGGNTYTPSPTGQVNLTGFTGGGSGTNYEAFEAFSVSTGASTTTFSLTGTGNFPVIECYSTTGGTGIFDGPAVGVGNNSGSLSVNIVPTGTKDLSSCVMNVGSAYTITAGTGYTLIATIGSANTMQYKVLSASGSQAATSTISTTVGADMMCWTIK